MSNIVGVLHYTEARERSKLVSSVHSDYTITVESRESNSFSVESKITFHYTPNKSDAPDPLKYLFLETTATAVHQVIINDAELSSEEIEKAHNKDKKRLYINPPNPSSEQDITLKVNYECEYTKEYDSGTHKIIFNDQFFIWSSYEPFTAHTAFICFNQPDIKTIFKLTIIAPKEYKSFSNSKEISVTPVSDTLTKREYDTFNKPIPSYIYCFILGDLVQTEVRTYTSIHDATRTIPLSVIVPKSDAGHIDSDVVMDTVADSLAYYETIFDEPYYYEKYDCAFVPEYYSGAMENPGLVLFNDKYVFREPQDGIMFTRRAETIVHETMHMWLGDAVSPLWWDSIWLSEGFASYFGYDAKRSLRDKSIGNERWVDYHNVKRKQCFEMELYKKTHPVQNTANGEDGGTYNTEVAAECFDPISYGKGCAVIKQLVATFGEETFLKALREYIKKFKFANADYTDFKKVFTQYIPEEWLDKWLLSNGLSSLIPTLTIDPATKHVASFTVHQEPTSYDKVLLPHHVEVGLFDYDPKASFLKLRKSIPIDILPVEGEQDFTATVFGAEEDRVNPPDFIYVNFRELTFAKCAIDSKSLMFIGTHLDKIVMGTDPKLVKDNGNNSVDADMVLLVMQILESLTTMMKDIMLTPEKFAACMIPTSMSTNKAHPKVVVEINKESSNMLAMYDLIPATSNILPALGKYCAFMYLSNNDARAYKIALKTLDKTVEIALFAMNILLSGGNKKPIPLFWRSLAALSAWKKISSLEQLKKLALTYLGIPDFGENEKVKEGIEDMWKITNGDISEAEAIWDKCLAEDPSGVSLVSEECYSGLFLAPCRERLLEIMEKKNDSITPRAIIAILSAYDFDTEFIDKISKLQACSADPEVTTLINRIKTINMGILIAQAKYYGKK